MSTRADFGPCAAWTPAPGARTPVASRAEHHRRTQPHCAGCSRPSGRSRCSPDQGVRSQSDPGQPGAQPPRPARLARRQAHDLRRAPPWLGGSSPRQTAPPSHAVASSNAGLPAARAVRRTVGWGPRLPSSPRRGEESDAITVASRSSTRNLKRLPACRACAADWRALVHMCRRRRSDRLDPDHLHRHQSPAEPIPRPAHMDTFHPTMKAWLFLQDVPRSRQPLRPIGRISPADSRAGGLGAAQEHPGVRSRQPGGGAFCSRRPT